MSRNSTDSWRHLRKGVDAFKSQSRILQTWEIVDYISSGSFGIVFKVRNKNTHEFGALKFVANPLDEMNCKPREESDSDDHYYNFKASQKEARIMFQFVGNPRIVQYLEIPEYLSREFINPRGQRVVQYAVLICMKLYQGYDGSRFNGWKDKTDKDLATRLQLGCDIAQALMTFEEAGIYHRDVKPGNILRDENGRFILGDVGEAKKESEASSIARHGTRRYMAPEVSALDGISRARSDYRSDIYSLGIVLYEAFNHEIPFLDAKGTLLPGAIEILKRNRLYSPDINSDDAALYLRNHGVRLPAPQEADDELAEIILKACAYRQEDRYQTAEELYLDLDAYARKHGITLPIGKDDKSNPHDPCPLHRLIAAIFVLFAAVLLAVVIVGMKEWPPRPPIETTTPAPTATSAPATPIPATPTATSAPATPIPATPTATPAPATPAPATPAPEMPAPETSAPETPTPKPTPTTKPTPTPTPKPTSTLTPTRTPTIVPAGEIVTGYTTGATGNEIIATVIIENEEIVLCRIQDDYETEHMRIGYDYCTQAMVGKTCDYVLKASKKTLFEDVRNYASEDGYAIMSGGTVHESIDNATTAIKDALKRMQE